MPNIDINHTVEDYLRSLYRLESRDGKASNTALARELAISSSAVTEMARRLADAGLLSYRKYQGFNLTAKGLRVALAVTRRHRLWESFLIEQLGFAWDEVHDIADRLEHIDSIELIDRIEKFLGYPTHDPHGDPIPTKDGRIMERNLASIGELKPGEEGIVERVSDEFPELLRYASSLGLAIKAHVRVVERIDFDGSVRLVANDIEAVVSEKLAQSVFVHRTHVRRAATPAPQVKPTPLGRRKK